jgi:hypothetical protein
MVNREHEYRCHDLGFGGTSTGIEAWDLEQWVEMSRPRIWGLSVEVSRSGIVGVGRGVEAWDLGNW